MHIETLKTFCDLIETGSFSKAAALNFVSQSAVSQQVKSLERRFDQQLIERGQRRGVAPTEAGKIFYAECREILDHLQHRPARTAALRQTVHQDLPASQSPDRVQRRRQSLRSLSQQYD